MGIQVFTSAGGQDVTLNFVDQTGMSGSGGCNSFGGSYRADSATNTISFSQVVSTMMACTDEDVMAVEGNYLTALNAAQAYTLSVDTLTITGGGHTIVFFRV